MHLSSDWNIRKKKKQFCRVFYLHLFWSKNIGGNFIELNKEESKKQNKLEHRYLRHIFPFLDEKFCRVELWVVAVIFGEKDSDGGVAAQDLLNDVGVQGNFFGLTWPGVWTVEQYSAQPPTTMQVVDSFQVQRSG